MEPIFAGLTGLFAATAFYLVMSRHVIRILLGMVILGNAVNLGLFTAGRLTREAPPIIMEGEKALAAGAANPLPQALILTAIVISFSFFAFLLVLTYRAYQDLETDDTDGMRLAEPEDPPHPPLGY
ncbi:Na+/H+ antiporter subunit C [Rhizobium paknamense]|uniref:Multicomponent Na+:H+ antiporter subunit C n=1 Tax=Rhizobium paknamense TaxID=1206817 RepID=A0ABU0I7Z6_9HYPH|nr:Na+/H+ antiporter subunit C [Rhizobium paknamense]MDQ0454332.1 multicomponent Na+:H+ antiporter subunit C [Rhizobium paknamense]